MRQLFAWNFLLMWLVFPVRAETIWCETPNVSVDARQSADADLVCKAVKQAEALFESCSLSAIPDQIRIEIVDKLKPGCVGVFHCGENLIRVLEPDVMDRMRKSDSAFAFLAIRDYFRSVIVHELTHSISENLPCPFEACITAHEYVAYGMQVMSLTSEAQAEFAENSMLDRKISRDELSTMIYFMAPNLFARKAWAHVSQRDDPCGFIGQIIDGDVLLDYERF